MADVQHNALTGTSLHGPYQYEQDADPGAVGAGTYWLDTNSGPPLILYRRNAGDTDWDEVGPVGFDDGATPANLAAAAATGDDAVAARRDHVHLDPVVAHAAAGDPHTGYQKESERGAANGYASLGADTLVPQDQLGTGTQDGTKYLRDDGTWQAIPAGLGFNDGATPADLSTPAATGDDAYPARRDHVHLDPVIAHAAAGDPHTGYQKESEKSQPSGYASLGADGKVPATELPAATGTVAAQGTYLVSGGQVVWQSALIFLLQAGTGYVDGVLTTWAQQSVTLDAADVSNPRIDVIGVDNTGTVFKLTGTAAASPSEPVVSPDTQLKLSLVTVDAGATAPTTSSELVYAENAGSPTEWAWTQTTGSGWTFNNATTPRTGSVRIQGSALSAGATARAQRGTGTIDPAGYTHLVLYLRFTSAWNASRYLSVWLANAGVKKGNALRVSGGFFGLDSANTTDYQAVAIPMIQLAVPSGTLVNQIFLQDVGGSISFGIDDVSFLAVAGSTAAVGGGLDQATADARYAQRSSNLSDLASAATARTNLGVSHANLGDVSADQHHAKLHAHDGADGSGALPHSVLTGLTTGNPHSQYQLASEKGAASGYASLDSGILVPFAQLPVGTGASQVAAGNHAHTDPLAGAVALPGDISPTQITANQNDYNPTGLSTASTLRLNSDASRNITGLQGGADGRLLIVHNIGSQNIVLKDESASSSAANRFALNADVTLGADQAALLQYDTGSSRWRQVGGTGSGGGGAALTVQEIDGTPADTAVTIIRVTNGKMTANSAGDVTLDLSGSGGAALTVEETDGSPSVANVDKIVVPEYSLTDNGSGDVALKLPTFHMRWSADAGITKDGSDLVDTWAGQSPWGRKLHQPTATNKPLWVASVINSQPIIRFDGTDNYLMGQLDGTTLGAWSIAIVVRPRAAESAEGILQWTNALSSGTPWILFQRYDNAGTPSTRWQVLGAFSFVTAHATDATRVYVLTYDGYTVTHSVDGGSDSTATGHAITTNRSGATNLYVGNGFNGYTQIDLAELLIARDYAWTSAERSALSTALKTKYGL